MSESLGEALPKEIARVREVLKDYESVGPAGAFAVMMIKKDIADAERAIMEGDLVAMIRSYKTLQDTNS